MPGALKGHNCLRDTSFTYFPTYPCCCRVLIRSHLLTYFVISYISWLKGLGDHKGAPLCFPPGGGGGSPPPPLLALTANASGRSNNHVSALLAISLLLNQCTLCYKVIYSEGCGTPFLGGNTNVCGGTYQGFRGIIPPPLPPRSRLVVGVHQPLQFYPMSRSQRLRRV